MSRVPFALVDGHVLLSLGGRTALLDTGAPVSFGRVPEVELPWAGRAAIGRADPLGREVGAVSQAMHDFGGREAAGVELDLLLGCDLLRGHRITLDWKDRTLAVEPSGARALRTHRIGLPTWEIVVEGRRCEAVVDTGARLSYVREMSAPSYRREGVARDFNFLLGRREDCDVPLVVCAVELPDSRLDLARLGLAVGAVERALRTAGLGAIVGTDLMSRLPATTIDV
ncbi:MAG: hypothetical protein QM765_22245 [Myxococcales bacterium]